MLKSVLEFKALEDLVCVIQYLRCGQLDLLAGSCTSFFFFCCLSCVYIPPLESNTFHVVPASHLSVHVRSKCPLKEPGYILLL